MTLNVNRVIHFAVMFQFITRFNVVYTEPHLTICIETNKLHKILVIRLFYISCSTCFGLY